MAGSTATLQCSVTLNQYSSYSDGMTTVAFDVSGEGGILTGTPIMVSGAIRTTNFNIVTLNVSEAVQYQCRATVAYMGINDQFVVEPSAVVSPNATLTLQSKQTHPISFHTQDHHMLYCVLPKPVHENHNSSILMSFEYHYV